MNCIKCGIPSKDTTRKCWKNHQMCVKCAVKHHPEDYDKTRHSRYGDGKKNPKRYTICIECNNPCSALMYWKMRTHVNTGMKVCNTCQIVYTQGKYKIVNMENNNE